MKHVCTMMNNDFNYLTEEWVKDGAILTGETSETLEVGDEIVCPSYPGNRLTVAEIIERRDSRDFPKGNGKFYKVKCTVQKIS